MKQLLLSAALIAIASSAQSETKVQRDCEYFEIQNLKVTKRTIVGCSASFDRSDRVRAVPVKGKPDPAPQPEPQPQPENDPEPVVEPVFIPEPIPQPEPTPVPEPTPEPVATPDDGNNGHGNDVGGVDSSNPGQSNGSQGGSKDHDDNGHGNDADGVDESNPGQGQGGGSQGGGSQGGGSQGGGSQGGGSKGGDKEHDDNGHGNDAGGVDSSNPGQDGGGGSNGGNKKNRTSITECWGGEWHPARIWLRCPTVASGRAAAFWLTQLPD
jgi:hypothetical protein